MSRSFSVIAPEAIHPSTTSGVMGVTVPTTSNDLPTAGTGGAAKWTRNGVGAGDVGKFTKTALVPTALFTMSPFTRTAIPSWAAGFASSVASMTGASGNAGAAGASGASSSASSAGSPPPHATTPTSPKTSKARVHLVPFIDLFQLGEF